MRGVARFFVVELKLYFRAPQATFFTLAFPLMMLFIFGGVYGNESTPFFGGFGSVDMSVPAYTALVIATTGLMGLTVAMTSYRETGVLRRLQATPLAPAGILAAEVFVYFVMTALGVIILVGAAQLIFGLRFSGRVLSMVGAFILCSLSFFSLGFVLAGLLPSVRSAHAVSMALFFPMIFLSGATIPREILPEAVQRYSQILPLTHVVNLLRALWIGTPWRNCLKETIVLAGMLAVGVAVSSRTFRWR